MQSKTAAGIGIGCAAAILLLVVAPLVGLVLIATLFASSVDVSGNYSDPYGGGGAGDPYYSDPYYGDPALDDGYDPMTGYDGVDDYGDGVPDTYEGRDNVTQCGSPTC